jgi:hypothetical protein
MSAHLTNYSYSTDPLGLRGEEWLQLSPHCRKQKVEKAFRFWREHGFPYYRLTRDEVRYEFARVLKLDCRKIFARDNLRSSNAGLKLANAFQPNMWRARVSRYLSPADVFNDDRLLAKAIERSLRIWPDRFGANASCLRRILRSFSGAASVSNYRPAVAKAIISSYSKEGSVVVDFSAGYGGRLLGALTLNRHYWGIEVNKNQVKGYQRMRRAILQAGFELRPSRFLNACAEHALPELPSAVCSLVFSSPPFFDWERYSCSPEQSFNRYRTYELWKSEFLLPVLLESYRVLEKTGYLVLNVTGGLRRPTRPEVLLLGSRIGFKLVGTHKMIFPKVPYLHPRDGNPTKKEFLLVFRK